MSLPPIDRLAALPDRVLEAWTAAMRAQRFDDEACDLLEQVALGANDPMRSQLMQWHLDRRPDPRLRFAMLMSARGALPRPEVETLMGADLARTLFEAGWFVVREGRVRSPFRVVPIDELWVVSDDLVNEPESVMPPGPATVKLSCYMPEQMTGSMLDIGCGPGTFALIAARRGAQRVLGTDINPRAVRMAELNARLNRLNAEFRTGDLTAPAEGARFDLIVSQPPYLPHAHNTPNITFLHGGPRGDELVRRLLHQLAAALTPEGEALVLSDVPLREGEDMNTYVRDVLGDTGLELLVLHAPAAKPEIRGLHYACFESNGENENYLDAVCRQIAQSDELGVTALRHALFIARRPAEGAERRATPMAARDTPFMTPATRSRLWSSVTAANLADDALLERRVRVAPGAEWVSRRPEPEGDFLEHRVRFSVDWPAPEQIVPEAGVALASLLQRSTRVADALAAYAELCDATVDEVRAPVLLYLRDGLLTGMLATEEAP